MTHFPRGRSSSPVSPLAGAGQAGRASACAVEKSGSHPRTGSPVPSATMQPTELLRGCWTRCLRPVNTGKQERVGAGRARRSAGSTGSATSSYTMTSARLGVLKLTTSNDRGVGVYPDGCTRLCSDVTYSERPPLAAHPDGLLLAPYAVHTHPPPPRHSPVPASATIRPPWQNGNPMRAGRAPHRTPSTAPGMSTGVTGCTQGAAVEGESEDSGPRGEPPGQPARSTAPTKEREPSAPHSGDSARKPR